MATIALPRAAAVLAADPELKTIAQVIKAARCSSGTAQRALAAQKVAQDEAADLLRRQLASGPKCVEHLEATADAAEISKDALIAAADALGVTTRNGWWKLRAEAAKPVQSSAK